jgi:hypothetical protein
MALLYALLDKGRLDDPFSEGRCAIDAKHVSVDKAVGNVRNTGPELCEPWNMNLPRRHCSNWKNSGLSESDEGDGEATNRTRQRAFWLIFRRTISARPISPVPNSANGEGSGAEEVTIVCAMPELGS